MQQTTDQDTHRQLKEATLFLAEYASTLMAVGAQTSRIQLNTVRMARSMGYHVSLLIFPKTISITLQDQERNHTYTYIKKTPGIPLNFKVNMKLSQLSWNAFDDRLPLNELWARLKSIATEKRESPWLVLVLVSLANACFCRLFDGNTLSMAIVFVATFVGFLLRQQLTKRGVNHLAVFVTCAFVSTMIGVTDYIYFHGGTEDMSLGTSMLYLVPGVPLINGVMDIVDNHVLDGLSRLTNALLLIICIAIGLSGTVILFGIDPTTFTSVTRPDIVSVYRRGRHRLRNHQQPAAQGTAHLRPAGLRRPRRALLPHAQRHHAARPSDGIHRGGLHHRTACRAVCHAHTLPGRVLRLPVAAAYGAGHVCIQGHTRPD